MSLLKIGIPINGSHKCNYAKGKLNLKYTPDDTDYYQGLECSAIIGKNGVGKSTILDFIEVAYEGTDSSGVIVWFDDVKYKYHVCPINLYIDEAAIKSKIDFVVESDFQKFIRRCKLKLIKANNLTGVESNTFSAKRKSNSFIHDMTLSQYAKGSKRVVTQRTNRLIKYFNGSSFFKASERPKVKFTFQFKSSSKAYLKSLLHNNDIIRSEKISHEEKKALTHQLNNDIAHI
ncbi:AAA family ATPase, partial [Sansalvadorimonas verongulae]|uniref:AAA family ATPase n=1 Tax=Sansalvadorimonas verongulae TaxID=2172824 RepID=UPI001E552159